MKSFKWFLTAAILLTALAISPTRASACNFNNFAYSGAGFQAGGCGTAGLVPVPALTGFTPGFSTFAFGGRRAFFGGGFTPGFGAVPFGGFGGVNIGIGGFGFGGFRGGLGGRGFRGGRFAFRGRFR